jgi:hypothetical protein
MIRLVSDIHSVYLVPIDYLKTEKMNDLIKIHNKIQKGYPKIYSGQEKVEKVKLNFDMSSYSSKYRACIEGIIYNLEAGSDNVFFWIRKLSDIERQDKVHKYGYLKMIWKIMNCFIDENDEYEFLRNTICVLQEFFKKMTHRERPIYLYHAVLLLVRRNEIDWQLKIPTINTPMVEVDKLYADHLHNGRMEMDGYVMDLHTKKMKWSPGCFERFAREGAYVKNENTRFVNPEYREIYVLLKKELDLYHSRGGRLQ